MDVWIILASQLLLISAVYSLDKDLSCAVCRAIIYEVDYVIGKVDPKKKIQVGSFRVDPKGNQNTYEKPYARSEMHLLEVFESICENFKDYAETTDDNGGRSIARTSARDGQTLSLKGIKISADTQKQLKFKCESLLEEYDEDMIALFGRENPRDLEKVICAEVTSQCTGNQLQVAMPVSEPVITKEDMDSESERTEDARKEGDDKEKKDDGQTDEDEELERLKEQYFKDNKSYDDIMKEMEANEAAKQTEKQEL